MGKKFTSHDLSIGDFTDLPHNIRCMDHKKYHQIQTQIEAARAALQTWNDRRTEAMIELDSIFTEMESYKKQVAANEEANQNTITDLKTKLQKSDQEFHKQFDHYTNDMQELKLVNEKLSNQLQEALNEIEKQKQAQKKMEEQYNKKIAQVASETEIRVADQQHQLRTQVTNLVAELQNIQTERKTISAKADQYEKELRVIRTQMMSFLNVTKEVAGTEVTAPIVVAANTMNSASNATPANKNTKKSNKLQSAEVIVDNLSSGPLTVNDYLKRFGY